MYEIVKKRIAPILYFISWLEFVLFYVIRTYAYAICSNNFFWLAKNNLAGQKHQNPIQKPVSVCEN